MALLVVLFIVVPIAELYVIIQVGERSASGRRWPCCWPTPCSARCCCATRAAAPGAASTKRWPQRRFPGKEVADGLLIVVGGTLLLAPGFLTDIVGLLLLIPPTRAIARSLLRRFTSAASRSSACRAAAAPGPGPTRRQPAATTTSTPPPKRCRSTAARAPATAHRRRLTRVVYLQPDALEAKCELGVLGHHLRGPGGVEDHLRVDGGTPGRSPTNSFICSETWGPIGQAGVVRVKVT